MDEKLTFTVTGMHCVSCTLLIDDSLEQLPGVLASSTNLRKNICQVTFDPKVISQQTLLDQVTELGYVASV